MWLSRTQRRVALASAEEAENITVGECVKTALTLIGVLGLIQPATEVTDILVY